jgi:hypothetical protein
MKKLAQILAALALAGAAGCISIPPDVEAEFSPPDGKRPNHYHLCADCARDLKDGKAIVPGGPTCPKHEAPR